MDAKKFLKKLLLILVLLIVCDFIIGKALHLLYFKQRSGILYRSTIAIDSTKADYLVFGSSRASHHYNPAVFARSLQGSFYNCGRDEQGIIYSTAVLDAVLNRYTPKFVVIDMRINEFTIKRESVTCLFPYQNNAGITPCFKFNSRYERIKMLSQMYPYNSILLNMITGLESKTVNHQEIDGYVPLHYPGPYHSPITFVEKGVVDTVMVALFEHSLAVLNKKGVPNMVIVSPAHRNFNGGVSMAIMKKIVAKYPGSKFCSYLGDKRFSDGHLYKDDLHLIDKAAGIFSADVAEKIKWQLAKAN